MVALQETRYGRYSMRPTQGTPEAGKLRIEMLQAKSRRESRINACSTR